MDDPISGDNSSTVVVDNPQGHIDNSVETSQPNGQPEGQTGHVDELFKGIDPNKLSPELRAQHDNMVRSYREKTEKLSETIKSETAKAIEAYRQKSDMYDQISSQEEFVKQWNDYVKKNDEVVNQNPEGNPKLLELEQKFQEIKQEMEIQKITEITTAFAEATDEKGNKIHPDFDQLNDIVIGNIQSGQENQEFSFLRACIELAEGNTPQEKLIHGYKTAKAIYDSIFEEGKKAGMGRLQTKVLNGTNPPSNSGGDVMSVTEKRPKNAREAMELAKKGVIVSRE